MAASKGLMIVYVGAVWLLHLQMQFVRTESRRSLLQRQAKDNSMSSSWTGCAASLRCFSSATEQGRRSFLSSPLHSSTVGFSASFAGLTSYPPMPPPR